jgi:hypothetical protein
MFITEVDLSNAGLFIRIDSIRIRIRIQQFSLIRTGIRIRTRISKVTETGSNPYPDRDPDLKSTVL